MTDGAPNGFTANWATQLKGGSDKCGPPSAGGTMIGYSARETATEWGIFNVGQWTSADMPGATGGGTPGNVADNGKCAMDSDVSTFYTDFSQVPTTDAYGDQLTGAGTYLPTTSLLFSGDSPLNQAVDELQFRNLSSNAADGAATRLRTDSLLRIAIYSVALAGNSGTNTYDLLDPILLQRMANAATSPIYNPSQPVGAYFYAQDATYLGAEFTAVASQISARLSK